MQPKVSSKFPPKTSNRKVLWQQLYITEMVKRKAKDKVVQGLVLWSNWEFIYIYIVILFRSDVRRFELYHLQLVKIFYIFCVSFI